MSELDQPGPPSKDARRGRTVALALMLVLLGSGYALLFSIFYRQAPPFEKTFQEEESAKAPLEMYLEVVRVDPVREAIEVRVDFSRSTGPDGRHFPGTSPIDLMVDVSDGADVQEIKLQAGQPTPSKSLELAVTGDLRNYPLDRYTGQLWIRAFAGKDPTGGVATPVHLRTWEDIDGWTVTMSKNDLAANETGLALKLAAQRPPAQIFFVFLLCAAMVLIACSALTVGSLIFLGARKIDDTFVGALAAMVFSVPALRSVFPGAPPLGVRADDFVFLWVQIAVILGLTLSVGTWAERGPRP
jgi:hypothetical protein